MARKYNVSKCDGFILYFSAASGIGNMFADVAQQAVSLTKPLYQRNYRRRGNLHNILVLQPLPLTRINPSAGPPTRITFVSGCCVCIHDYREIANPG
jgi:hypothetical protein